MGRRDTRIYGPNRFKVGLFSQNCSGGLTMTRAPEFWDASWENNVVASRLADEAGLEFLLPVARWLGYGGEIDAEGENFETLTWATGMLCSTEEIVVFGTVHVALVNPVFAAKQMVSADLAGRGRFGLNMVSGWNVGEHSMFGIQIREHDQRYAFTEEWLEIVERIWAGIRPFYFRGKFFDLKGVESWPKPYGNERPMLVSAGNSPVGRDFALRRADCVFMGIREIGGLASEISAMKKIEPSPRLYFGCGNLIIRPTQKEAEDYYHYLIDEMGDWSAVDHALGIRSKGGASSSTLSTHTAERMLAATGTYPFVGGYDEVVDEFRRMSQAGLNGVAIGLVNYIDDLPQLRDEVLPRLVRLGLRES
ncbi:MAG: LLM class flavin-dependent oxidoreductase [Pseudomonadota bacterium]|nr:LLM class flavin-dependent oxidoreductase [Pseudomonadota bacterium]